jgi:hypothetical protein
VALGERRICSRTGTYFVPLEAVLGAANAAADHRVTRSASATTAKRGLEERISRALEAQKVLIVLDTFEQIVEAAPLVVRSLRRRFLGAGRFPRGRRRCRPLATYRAFELPPEAGF